MNETPDFEQAARNVLIASADGDVADAIATELRRTWNARGASDIATVERELSSMMGATAGGPYIKNLDRALRKLDG
jgi:ApbE superfamily uncharacterized protein (UPF0280 family)